MQSSSTPNPFQLLERKTTEIKVEATKLLGGNRETFKQVHKENGAL